MDLQYEVVDGIAFTYVNGVKGTLNGYDTQALLYEMKALEPDSKYVEIGSYLGCSGVIAGLTMKGNPQVYCHDMWMEDMTQLPIDGGPPPKVENHLYQFYENVKKNKLERVIIPIRGDSSYTIGIHDDNSIDLSFVDGDHSYDGVTKDLEAILPKMKSKSVILCHDCHGENEVTKAVRDFCIKNQEFAQGHRVCNGRSSIVKIYLEPSSTPQCHDNTSSDPS